MPKTIFILILAGLFLFNGCASFPVQKPDKPTQPLESAKILKFEDVPVPQGFKLLSNESFIFETDTTRVGLLKYSGGPSADQVVSFYKEQMIQYGWSMINVVEYGRRILNFEREDQSCVITVEPATTKTIFIISVAPKSKGYKSSNYKSETPTTHNTK